MIGIIYTGTRYNNGKKHTKTVHAALAAAITTTATAKRQPHHKQLTSNLKFK